MRLPGWNFTGGAFAVFGCFGTSKCCGLIGLPAVAALPAPAALPTSPGLPTSVGFAVAFALPAPAAFPTSPGLPASVGFAVAAFALPAPAAFPTSPGLPASVGFAVAAFALPAPAALPTSPGLPASAGLPVAFALPAPIGLPISVGLPVVVGFPVVVGLPTACPRGCETCPAGGPFFLACSFFGGGVCAAATNASAKLQIKAINILIRFFLLARWTLLMSHLFNVSAFLFGCLIQRNEDKLHPYTGSHRKNSREAVCEQDYRSYVKPSARIVGLSTAEVTANRWSAWKAASAARVCGPRLPSIDPA